MGRLVVYYPGMSAGEVEGDDYLVIKDTLKTKYKADEVQIINWEKWRDRQPLARFLVQGLKLGSLFARLPLTLAEPLIDMLSDIPSVYKYVKTELPHYDVVIVKRYMEELQKRVEKEVEIVFVGHSLGTVTALQLSQYFQGPQHSVELYAPPIGFKGFHHLFRPILTNKIKQTIYLGLYDPLTKLINPKDLEDTNPQVRVQLVDSGHDFFELTSKEPRVVSNIGLGNLLKKLNKGNT
jgi:hypothetical protein